MEGKEQVQGIIDVLNESAQDPQSTPTYKILCEALRYRVEKAWKAYEEGLVDVGILARIIELTLTDYETYSLANRLSIEITLRRQQILN